MLSCYHLTASMHWVIHERVCHKAAVNLLKHPDEVLLFREELVFLRIKMGLQYALSYYQKFRLDERDACFLNHVVTSAKLQSMREGGGGISPADFDGKLPIILVFALPIPTCFVWGLRIVAVAQLPSLIYPNFWVSACEFGLKNKLEMVVFVIYVNLVFISAW